MNPFKVGDRVVIKHSGYPSHVDRLATILEVSGDILASDHVKLRLDDEVTLAPGGGLIYHYGNLCLAKNGLDVALDLLETYEHYTDDIWQLDLVGKI